MSVEQPGLIVIGGPTASGKTAAAVVIARELGTEIISADSRQFYSAMRIGTARPSAAEMDGVKHHFIGQLDITETWSAGQFAREARNCRFIAAVGHASAHRRQGNQPVQRAAVEIVIAQRLGHTRRHGPLAGR